MPNLVGALGRCYGFSKPLRLKTTCGTPPMIVARSFCWSPRRRPTRALLPIVAGAAVLTSWFLLASPAPAADTDLTAAVLEAWKAVDLPAIDANPAVSAAAVAVLDGGNPQGRSRRTAAPET